MKVNIGTLMAQSEYGNKHWNLNDSIRLFVVYFIALLSVAAPTNLGNLQGTHSTDGDGI
jgi:hypothetical protein